jgi:O-antigen/teichoic acid export membrane protein
LKPFDARGAFQPAAEDSKLRQLALRGVGATLLSGGFGLAIQIVATMVLARLLTPRDFGLVTMVTTFSLLLMNFGLNGFTEAIIQREEISHQLASNLFWISVGASLVLAIGFAAAGSPLARLYKDPRVAGVTQALALTIFLTGLSVIHMALLKRAMRFSVVSVIDIVGRIASVSLSIVLAWAGWEYWALVLGTVVTPAITCILAWTVCQWLPGCPRRAAGTGTMVQFAINTYGRFATGYFSNNLDNFLIGWRLGATSLGFYKKAFDLFVLPSSQLSTGMTIVAVSALSRLQRNLDQYRSYFLSALGVMAFVGMGLSVDLTLVGRDLILVLLGSKWGESGRIFTVFGPGIGVMLLYGTHIWIHLSIGRADRWFRWGLVDLVITALSLLLGIHWGAEGIALAWVVSYWVITLPALWYAGKPIQLEISRMIAVTWKYLFASATAGGAVVLIARGIPSLIAAQGSLWAFFRALMISALFGALYLGAVIALHGSCAPLKQVARLLREMISRRTPSDSSPPSESTADRAEGLQPDFAPTSEIS